MNYTPKTKLDANHAHIAGGLAAYGYGVTDMAAVGGGMTDLLVSDRKRRLTVAMEIKTATGRLKLTQLKFLANFQGYAAFVETLSEAVSVMLDPEGKCLSDNYKTAISAFLVRWEPEAAVKQKTKNPQILMKAFRKF